MRSSSAPYKRRESLRAGVEAAGVQERWRRSRKLEWVSVMGKAVTNNHQAGGCLARSRMPSLPGG